MSKSKEFNNALDECLERLLVKGETIEQCLQSFPKQADELKPLLETALATSQTTTIQPSAEFRNKARQELYSVLEEMGQRRSRPFFSWWWQPRWATAVVIVLALFLASGGTVAAASGSMPDSPLYPVKLATEQVQLTFTFSEIGKAELHARLADKRVAEIVYLADKNKSEKIARATDRLNTHLTEIVVLTSAQDITTGIAMAPTAEVELAVVEDEEGAVEESFAPEEATVGEARVSEQPTAEEAPLTEPGKAKEASGKVERWAKLKNVVAQQSNNNMARLRALLETVPVSARPALLRAIAVSETAYEKALEALD